MAKCTYIDGIASSQAIDTAGEVVDIKGLDCSSLLGAAFNYEHKSDLPAQIIGKVLDYKKIFKKEDCENERHEHFWEKIKMPFLYVMGRLFDDKKESSKEVAALFQDDAENPNEPNMLGFSIEGAKVHKEGMVITKSIARKVTITNLPANKTCVAGILTKVKKEKDVDSLFKGEVEFFSPNSKYLEFLAKKENDMEKDVGSGGGAFIGSQLAMSEEDMKKSAPSWSSGKASGDSVHFSHPEHGTVSIHKQPSGEFHVKHQGKLAGLGGVKGSFKTAGDAGKHAKNYMSAVSNKKVMAPQMHNRPSPSMIGKAEMNKALEAGSSMGVPSNAVQGAALAKENVDKKIKKSKWLARAEEAYNTWEKKEQFEQFMKSRLPHLSKGEIKAIGQTLALKKSVDAEGKLDKMFASYYGKKEQMGTVPPSKNESNEIVKTTDVMMASEKKKD